MTELSLQGVAKSFGTFAAVRETDLALQDGRFVCFLGPSGCGKTTLLRLIAGLETPSSGRIMLGGKDITALPAHKRNVGMVFQSLALFPHLNVGQNIAYGMQMAGQDRAASMAKAGELLDLVQLSGYADRAVSALSGGQRQRVAIARALALEPQIFLLDEPLSALDANLREEMQVELRQLQQRLGVTTIMVTHDQSEAMTTADTLVVMNNGKIEQVGAPLEVYQNPANAFVAGFVGSNNLIPGKAQGQTVQALGTRLKCDHAADGDVTLSIRPEHLDITDTPGKNCVEARVEFLRDLGFEVEAFFCVGDERVSIKWVPKGDPDLVQGDVKYLHFPADKIKLHVS
ncbi:ABC transporter ATP-binding protein [Ruegeria sp. EL01]|uniref:ABC transporter ATP-binding protein n=1 Tax=Ruegeria sp. EL01 TaxID=2107578 RepID=UPI000EA82C2B|nr:ABC transporter ATP-binding protein [Ruegeria sp. EL01]